MSKLPEIRKRAYFTTARVVHDPNTMDNDADWLWVNGNESHHFYHPSMALELMALANENGRKNGLDIDNYPYFVVRVETTSRIEKYVAQSSGTTDKA